MATSGTYTQDYTVREMIDEAFSRLQIDEATLGPRHYLQGQRSLQLMLRDWDNDGFHLFTIDQGYAPTDPSEGDTTLTLPAGVIDIAQATVIDTNGFESPMVPLSRDEYTAIPDKDLKGQPDRYWVDRPGTSDPVMYFWQAADSTGYGFRLNLMYHIEDVGDATKTLALPAQFHEAVAAGLAWKLAFKFSQPTPALQAEAERAFRRAKMGNRELGDTVISLSMGGRRRRGR